MICKESRSGGTEQKIQRNHWDQVIDISNLIWVVLVILVTYTNWNCTTHSKELPPPPTYWSGYFYRWRRSTIYSIKKQLNMNTILFKNQTYRRLCNFKEVLKTIKICIKIKLQLLMNRKNLQSRAVSINSPPRFHSTFHKSSSNDTQSSLKCQIIGNITTQCTQAATVHNCPEISRSSASIKIFHIYWVFQRQLLISSSESNQQKH